MAKTRAERRREEAATQFSPFAIAGERYEDLLPAPKPPQRRRKQVYKSRMLSRVVCGERPRHSRRNS
jgi:hypothetical protein